MNMMSQVRALNTPPGKEPWELWRHFSDTYVSIRVGLALLAFAFPVLLFVWGRGAHGLPLQPSMSAYFWASDATHCASFPLRTAFVGVLIAIAAGLYLYKGLTKLENLLLNAAAIFAVVVAAVPERIDATDPHPRVAALFKNCPAVETWSLNEQPDLPYHYLAAVALFVCLFFVAWACACKSLEYLPENAAIHAPLFRRTYRAIALAMPVWGVIGGTWVYLARDGESNAVFFLEMGSIWIFGAYWAVKTYELSLSRLDRNPVEAVRNAAPTRHAAPAEQTAGPDGQGRRDGPPGSPASGR
jgi:hypothetical protein